eukprot:653841-Lingulodinium_polyedra.AAC.1
MRRRLFGLSRTQRSSGSTDGRCFLRGPKGPACRGMRALAHKEQAKGALGRRRPGVCACPTRTARLPIALRSLRGPCVRA